MLSYAFSFRYRNEYSTKYDLITNIAFSEDTGFSQMSTATAVEAITSDKYDGTKIDYSSRYTEQIELQITMIKKDYSDFSRDEKRAILRWLSSHKQASWLSLYDEDESEIIQFFGRFASVEEKTADSRTVGFFATFVSPFPYGFSPLREIEQEFIGSETIRINNDTDATDEYVCPYFVITPNIAIDKLSIKNKNTNITTFIKNLKANETLTLDSENKLAFTSDEFRIMGSDFYGDVDGFITNYPIFIELEPGINTLFINTENTSCKCTYSMSYRYPVKLGTIV